jgi:amino acid transporter
MGNKDLLGKLQANYKKILGFVTWLLAILGTFIADPGIVSDHLSNSTIKSVANLLVALLVVTFLLFLRKTPTLKTKRICLAFAWLLLSCGMYCLYRYDQFLDGYTVQWPPSKHQSVVVGDHYTASFSSLLKEDKSIKMTGFSKEDAVKIFAPTNVKGFGQIWSDEEIKHNGLILIGCYLLLLTLFTSFLLFMTYSLNL